MFVGGIFPSVLKNSSMFILRGKDSSLLGLLDLKMNHNAVKCAKLFV